MNLPVEDRLLIHELYARYSWALDTCDTEAYVRLFLPDAVVIENAAAGTFRIQGHDAIRTWVHRFHDDPAFPGRQHRMSQIVITPHPDGRDDRWRVRSYVTTTQSVQGSPPTLYWCGWCADIVAKVDGEWFLAEREIRPWDGKTG
jgi:hypothetical protein